MTRTPDDDDGPAIELLQAEDVAASPPDARVRGSELSRRFDQVATTLIGATAAVSALFALLGANADRVWALLDDTKAQFYVYATAATALLAIALGLVALISQDLRKTSWILLGGAAAFIGTLAFAISTAAYGANQRAEPLFSQVLVERPSAGSATLRFTTHLEGLDRPHRIGVLVVDMGTSGVLFEATLWPNGTGVVDQEVLLALPVDIHAVQLVAWHREEFESLQCDEPTPYPPPTPSVPSTLSAGEHAVCVRVDI